MSDNILHVLSSFPSYSRLLTAKSKWSPSFTADNPSLFGKSLYAGVDERKRVVNPREVIAPTYKLIANFSGSHWTTRIFIKGRQNKIRPSDFSLNVLSKCVLKSYFGRLQLRNFYVQFIALRTFIGNLLLNLTKGFANLISHNFTLYLYVYNTRALL
jgi:hypothetical protein